MDRFYLSDTNLVAARVTPSIHYTMGGVRIRCEETLKSNSAGETVVVDNTAISLISFEFIYFLTMMCCFSASTEVQENIERSVFGKKRPIRRYQKDSAEYSWCENVKPIKL